MGYLCANFSLPRPLCSRLRPDVRDRQTSDVRRASSLTALYPRGGDIIALSIEEDAINKGKEQINLFTSYNKTNPLHELLLLLLFWKYAFPIIWEYAGL